MTETIEYEQFQQAEGANDGSVPEADFSRLSDIPMELSVEIGRTRMTVAETLELRPGAVVSLERQTGEPVELLVNGTPIARGEVVVIDDRYGLRVTEILDERQQAGPDAASADAVGVEEPDAEGEAHASTPTEG